jgi:hypothetical protein
MQQYRCCAHLPGLRIGCRSTGLTGRDPDFVDGIRESNDLRFLYRHAIGEPGRCESEARIEPNIPAEPGASARLAEVSNAAKSPGTPAERLEGRPASCLRRKPQNPRAVANRPPYAAPSIATRANRSQGPSRPSRRDARTATRANIPSGDQARS